MRIPDCSEDALIIRIFYEFNPCYSVFRSFAVIYYFIQEKGSFTWSDISAKVVGDRWNKNPAGGYEFSFFIIIRLTTNIGYFFLSYIFFYYCAWYYSYRSMCHKKCCFYLTKSFWVPETIVKMEYSI